MISLYFTQFRLSILFFCLIIQFSGLKSQSLELDSEGFEVFNFQDGDSTIVMKKYFMVFLQEGPNRSQDEEEARSIQTAHLEHLRTLADNRQICIAGPFGDEGKNKGIVIFNVKSEEEVLKLANSDPAVVAGRLIVEVHPWWAKKGASLF